MRHPDAETLALHAGDDLTGWSRWRVERHLRTCEVCRDEVAGLQSIREMLPDAVELPDLNWNRLASEMNANIRLGLEAGECVRQPAPLPAPRFAWNYRYAAGALTVAALAIAALVIERPKLFHGSAPEAENVILQTAPDGIGNQDLKLMVHGAQDVQMSASAQGSVGARYTDPDTGVMTVIQVDAQ